MATYQLPAVGRRDRLLGAASVVPDPSRQPSHTVVACVVMSMVMAHLVMALWTYSYGMRRLPQTCHGSLRVQLWPVWLCLRPRPIWLRPVWLNSDGIHRLPQTCHSCLREFYTLEAASTERSMEHSMEHSMPGGSCTLEAGSGDGRRAMAQRWFDLCRCAITNLELLYMVITDMSAQRWFDLC